MLGTWEIIAIFLLILLIFGGKKIPEVARGLGKGMREFKKARNDITDSLNASIDDIDDDDHDDDVADNKTTEMKNDVKDKKDVAV